MKGKIIVEEAWMLPRQAGHGSGFAAKASASQLDKSLIDIEGRIAQMDATGVEMQLLSFTSPGTQGITEPGEAERVARESNDYIAEQVKKHPKRFAAFAAVSMHDPQNAADEARRCVAKLGFCGVMLNDFQSSGDDGNTMLHYDDKRYDIFWQTMEELDRPVYMHPRLSSPLIHQQLYAKRPWLEASAWGFASQLSLHILGIATSGVFDRFPKLQLVMGHLGEHIIADLWRLDHKLIRDRYPSMPMSNSMLIRDYFERNMSITTSGHFSTRTLSNAIVEIGSDRILFAVDYPYEDGLGEGCAWFDACDISDGDKRRIGRENSIKMFHLEDRLETGMTCHQLGIGGLRGNIYPEHAGHLRVNT